MSEEKNAVQKLIDQKHDEVSRLRNCIALLEKIQWLKGIKSASIYNYTWSDDPPLISLAPEVPEKAGELVGHARRALKVKQTTRSLSGETGLVRFYGKSSEVRIDVVSKPTACKIRRVVEPVEIPEQIIPAHTEDKVTYVIENPEECGAAAGVEEAE